MGVAATPKFNEGAYWMDRERKEFGDSEQKFSDHHAFYVGYNITCLLLSHKCRTGVWGHAPRKNVHKSIPCNTGECPFVNIIY